MTDVHVCGVATDYCVKFTALDASQLGFKTHVVADACRGVNLSPHDAEDAIAEMKRVGVHIVQSTDMGRAPL